MFEEIDLNYFFNNEYVDRKLLKWAGFYLSEHTEETASHSAGEIITKEDLMSPDEINQVLI